VKPQTRVRSEIPDEYRWDLSSIFPTWQAWDDAFVSLESLIAAFAARRGSLASGPDTMLGAFQAMDELGQLAYSVWYYPSLAHDEDQRDNEIGARRQRVQILMARWQQATSWFNPELLALPLERVREWMAGSAELAVYRFAIENLYRLQEHVLDDKGEQLMSLVSRFDSAPSDAYEALSTADAKFPAITLSDGRRVTVSYGEFRSILATARQQGQRWKLVCTARCEGAQVHARVAPQPVGPESPLYGVEGTSSIVTFETDVLSQLSIVEGNPGPETTAYGLLADFISAARGDK